MCLPALSTNSGSFSVEATSVECRCLLLIFVDAFFAADPDGGLDDNTDADALRLLTIVRICIQKINLPNAML